MAAITHVTNPAALRDMLANAVEQGKTELVVQFGNADCQAEEVERIVRGVQSGADGRGWTVNFYPSRENVGLAEILMSD